MDSRLSGTRGVDGESGGMDLPSRDLGSDVIDLSGCTLEDLRSRDIDSLMSPLGRLLEQVYRPRVNFDGTGPPGRAD
jgi:hypothetical protein